MLNDAGPGVPPPIGVQLSGLMTDYDRGCAEPRTCWVSLWAADRIAGLTDISRATRTPAAFSRHKGQNLGSPYRLAPSPDPG